MTIKEEVRDLFAVPQGYYLAHCISHDFALGAGIAKQFTEVYNMRKKLNKFYGFSRSVVGETCLVDNVFNLITKERYFEKPTYGSLIKCLKDMKDQMSNLMISKLAIPQIGCGLDRLNWENVRAIIEEVFNDTDVEILVCIL